METESKTSIFTNSLIWFGAAVSIAEILAGALIAPLGLRQGLTAIVLGHIIGCALLYFAGLIGAKTGKSAMETVKMSFGQKGALIFVFLNIIQLIGWTSVMLESAAVSASKIVALDTVVWCAVTGALILVWLLVGFKSFERLNAAAMGALFIFTLVLSAVAFRGGAGTVEGSISFSGAVELSAAMPVSWLPLISDYTRRAKKPAMATFASAATYFLASCWMYAIGLGAALFAGNTDIAQIMLGAGMGVMGLLIIVFSTVTTTYLDVYSAGVSSVSISPRINERYAACAVLLAGTVLAAFTPTSRYENFLYLIGSVFAPMLSVMLASFFVLKKDSSNTAVNVLNIAVWAAGFIAYHVFLRLEAPFGSTLPAMLITFALCVFVNIVLGGMKNVKESA